MIYELQSAPLVNSKGVFLWLTRVHKTMPEYAEEVLCMWEGIKREDAEGILTGNGWQHSFSQNEDGEVVTITSIEGGM